MSIQLFPHQRKAVDEMHNGCVLVGGVGTGKSLTSIAYYYEKVCKGVLGVYGSMEVPRDLYIITTAKKRDSLDWERDAIGFGLGKDPALNHQNVSITIDSWNNISKYKDTKGAFFIFDESRIVGSGAWVKAFLAIAKENEWILLSATPGDTWLDYIPLFLANGFYKNRTEFKREHVIYSPYSKFPKVERYIAVGKLVRHRNAITVQMPYVRHTKRHLIDVPVEYDKELFEKVVKNRWHVYEERPQRNVSEMFSVMRRVVNSDASRIEALKEVLEKHPRVIVFYNFNYELEILRSMVEDLTSSSKNFPQSTPTPDHMTNGSSTTCDLCGSPMSGPSCGSWEPCPDGNGDLWVPCHTRARAMSTERLVESASRWDVTQGKNLEGGLRTARERRRTSNSTPTDSMSTSQLSSGCKDSLSKHGLETPSNTEMGTAGSSFAVADEVCGFKFKGQLCVEPLPCIRHEGLSPGIPTPKAEPEATFAIAEWNGQKHEPIPETERWVYLVQYMAGAEGWNCTDTNAVVFYSQTYSYKQFEQAQGRIDRLNTPYVDLYYYNLLSRAPIDTAIRRALKQKRSFNESDLTLLG